MSGPRLIAVFGYSDGRCGELHRICAGRLRRAELEARDDDVVLLSGWARGRPTGSEAELMSRSWSGSSRRIVLDEDARSTVGNVVGAATLARRLNARQVLVVTSPWHARRAALLLRVALRRSGSTVGLATTDDRASLRARLREAACWALVPVEAIRAARAGTRG